jgi:hypothetical protein
MSGIFGTSQIDQIRERELDEETDPEEDDEYDVWDEISNAEEWKED